TLVRSLGSGCGRRRPSQDRCDRSLPAHPWAAALAGPAGFRCVRPERPARSECGQVWSVQSCCCNPPEPPATEGSGFSWQSSLVVPLEVAVEPFWRVVTARVEYAAEQVGVGLAQTLHRGLGNFPAGLFAAHHQDHAVNHGRQAEAIAARIDGLAINHDEAVVMAEGLKEPLDLLMKQVFALAARKAQRQQIKRQVGVLLYTFGQLFVGGWADQQVEQSRSATHLV